MDKQHSFQIVYKISRFLYALFWHIVSGFPTCTQKEINDRYSICILCDKMDHKKSICSLCGCNLSNRKEFMNKLAWADQECPESRWTSIKK